MLREIQNPRQIKNEPFRRWFNDAEMDLIVWINESHEIAAFQLSYDKPHSEHALAWSQDSGFRHYRVDDGEARLGKYKETPLLTLDGEFDISRIAKRFQDNAGDLDEDIVDFVYGKLITIS